LIELAEIEPWMLVLEPSAGGGAIAREIAKIATVESFELQPHHVAELRAGGFVRTVFAQDFLIAPPAVRYERVVMNPPFARQADIRHVEHALRFLKPAGRLVSVMSAGVTFRKNTLARNFRHLVERRGGRIEANPPESFRLSGTLIETVTVTIPA
jgi:predicted RNA methylase